MSSGVCTGVGYDVVTLRETVTHHMDVAWVACDADGCRECLSDPGASEEDGVRERAGEDGWLLGTGNWDDYCPEHKALAEAT